MVVSVGLNLVEHRLTLVEGTVTQMDEDMGDSPETPECERLKLI